MRRAHEEFSSLSSYFFTPSARDEVIFCNVKVSVVSRIIFSKRTFYTSLMSTILYYIHARANIVELNNLQAHVFYRGNNTIFIYT